VNQEFGAERVIDVIERTYTKPAKEIVSEMFTAVQNFCGDAPQSDDRTVVVMKINQLGASALAGAGGARRDR
jgi:serine phosphatase RsbU (regulator of sigma subunit)